MHVSNNPSNRLQPIYTLQGGRAIAALMVVAFHLHVFVLPQRIYAETGDGVHTIAAMGYSGVEFFFALSGFLMAYVHRNDWGKAEAAGIFLRKRIARIYPAYWFVVVPFITLSILVPSIGPEQIPNVLDVIGNLALIPSETPPILTVAWTLQYEIVFYLIFVSTILLGRTGLMVLSVWGAVCGINFFIDVPGLFGSFFLSAYNLIFLFGILAAIAYRHLSESSAKLCTIVGVLVFFTTGLLEAYGIVEYRLDVRTLSYGIAAAAIIAGLASQEASGKIKCPAFLKEIGDASYMLYLVHMPLFTATAVILIKANVGEFIPPWLMTMILVSYSVVVSVILYRYIEKPMVRFSNRVLEYIGRALGGLSFRCDRIDDADRVEAESGD